ncbi:hypothetical protein ACOSQ3_016826 [Xanthoceras sorbifolium]
MGMVASVDEEPSSDVINDDEGSLFVKDRCLVAVPLRENTRAGFVFRADSLGSATVAGGVDTAGRAGVPRGRRWKRRVWARNDKDTGMVQGEIGGEECNSVSCSFPGALESRQSSAVEE